MKKKLLFLMLITAFLLMFAACGGTLDTTVNLNEDFSGTRVMKYTVSKSDFNEYVSGDTVEANGSDMNINLRLFWRSGRTGILRIVRNGEDVFRENVKFDTDDTEIDIAFKISESDNSWYLPILETNDGKICSVASPIYFRNENFVEPEVIPMPKSIPEEFLAELQALTVDELSEFELIDRVAEKLKKLNEVR